MLKGPFSFQRSLVLNLTLVVILLGGAMLTTELIVSNHIVRELSKANAESVIARTEEQIDQLFEPVESLLEVAAYRVRKGLFQGQASPENLDTYFMPVISKIPHLSSVVVANPTNGDSYLLLRQGDAWKSRVAKPETWGKRVLWREWTDSKPTPVKSWREIDYDARGRPWHKGALVKIEQKGVNAPAYALIHWTRPFMFFTSKKPGVTASIAVDNPDSTRVVIAANIRLEVMSEYTRNIQVSESGMVFVLDGHPSKKESVLIGVPLSPRSGKKSEIDGFLLRPPQELGGPVAEYIAAIQLEHEDPGVPIKFRSDGEDWWGMLQHWDVLEEHPLWVGTVIPEADLLDGIPDLTYWVIGLTALFLLLGVMRSARLSRIYSSPIEGLVHQGERMQRLNFQPSEPIRSNIVEIRLLATTLERMRQALHSFSSVREDIRIARSIRRAIIPAALPTVPGFEIEAWSEPSSEVGGEAYDVVDFWTNLQTAGKAAGLPDGVALFIFDAAGLGVNTAVEGSQLRAIFRTGVRLGVDLPVLADQMNQFLRTDAPDFGPVRSWYGLLNSHDSQLTSLCLGQEPVLRFIAAEQTFQHLDTPSSSLGLEDQLAITRVQSVPLAHGDILVIASDGVVDTLSLERERFGVERIKQVIREHQQADAKQILEQLRQALSDFASGSEADEDQTIFLIKCV